MRYLRLICVSSAALLALSVGVVAAQGGAPFGAGVRTETNHLVVTSSANATDAAPGQRLALVFDVAPKKDMHVYAPGKHDYQVITVAVDPQPWLQVPPTTYPPSEIHDFKELNEKIEVYSKPFRLVQDVTILGSSEAKKLLAGMTTVTLSGRVEYQACDEKVCYAPKKVPFSFTLNVKAPERKPAGQ
jgi:hypothetical protein